MDVTAFCFLFGLFCRIFILMTIWAAFLQAALAACGSHPGCSANGSHGYQK
jgi:hypothetical protein